MNEKLVSAELTGNFLLRIRFEDGAEGEIDFSEELDGGIFEPLREPDYFSRFRIHPELGVLVWPNGADFAPEFLYSRLKASV